MILIPEEIAYSDRLKLHRCHTRKLPEGIRKPIVKWKGIWAKLRFAETDLHLMDAAGRLISWQAIVGIWDPKSLSNARGNVTSDESMIVFGMAEGLNVFRFRYDPESVNLWLTPNLAFERRNGRIS